MGLSEKCLYSGITSNKNTESARLKETDQTRETRRLQAERVRVTEERDILKKATAYFARDAK